MKIGGLMSAVVIICSGVMGLAQSRKLMVDPLFAISYNPQNVRFESLPASLVGKCPELRGRYTQGWVFGHLKTAADSEYFLISGMVQYRDAVTGAPTSIAPDETAGLAVAFLGSKCLVDQADYFLTQKINPANSATPIMASESVLTGILKDAFKRYAEAFGGKKTFLKLAHEDAIGPPVVLEQLKLYKTEPLHNGDSKVKGSTSTTRFTN